ncbi:protein of unknown function [Hymenobacter arizonensis]|uniref:DUF4844 domain-containing protein n=2 Tax=Hymenobacter arizonensis TaxID=1227077 RepID=A0A1I5YSD0_HYMAR|nr:protein of unknown function [Hymenobacter arizonensis]
MGEQLISQLRTFQARRKFANSEFELRGLMPSDSDLCTRLDELFFNCSQALIELIEQNYSLSQRKKYLKAYLKSVERKSLDTEEAEFVAEVFFELAQIVDVDIKYLLNSWLYGNLMGSLIKFSSYFRKPELVIDTLRQPCSSCLAALETVVLARNTDVPDAVFLIVRCNACGGFNLVDHGPGIAEMRFINYTSVEQLEKSEYDAERAMRRLEQLKYFRK